MDSAASHREKGPRPCPQPALPRPQFLAHPHSWWGGQATPGLHGIKGQPRNLLRMSSDMAARIPCRAETRGFL